MELSANGLDCVWRIERPPDVRPFEACHILVSEGGHEIRREYKSECILGTESVPLGRTVDDDDDRRNVVDVDVIVNATMTRAVCGAVQWEYSIVYLPFSIMPIPPRMVYLA